MPALIRHSVLARRQSYNPSYCWHGTTHECSGMGSAGGFHRNGAGVCMRHGLPVRLKSQKTDEGSTLSKAVNLIGFAPESFATAAIFISKGRWAFFCMFYLSSTLSCFSKHVIANMLRNRRRRLQRQLLWSEALWYNGRPRTL